MRDLTLRKNTFYTFVGVKTATFDQEQQIEPGKLLDSFFPAGPVQKHPVFTSLTA